MRVLSLVLFLMLSVACGGHSTSDPVATSTTADAPRDAQHQGVTGPHGDHTPHHGGMVLMNGDVHYEVVLSPDGRHQVWFSDAMRNELPASIASGVRLEIARPDEPMESLALKIDEAGEAWVAQARPLAGEGIMVKVRYALQGEPFEIEVPFTPAATRQ
jgi:hypothetical protein